MPYSLAVIGYSEKLEDELEKQIHSYANNRISKVLKIRVKDVGTGEVFETITVEREK